MKSTLYIIVSFALFVFACTSNTKSGKIQVEMYCAASLNEVISELPMIFKEKNGVKVKINLPSSGTLARQIENGATPAIFISDNKEWVDYLDSIGLIVSGFGKSVAGNSLVLVVPVESGINSMAFSPEINLPELFKGRLSLGDPQHVPAGNYTVQLHEKLGCKTELECRFLPAKDVRSALMVVELGEVEASIVYKTDALKLQKVKIVTEYPDSLYQPVYYYMAIIKGQKSEVSVKLYN